MRGSGLRSLVVALSLGGLSAACGGGGGGGGGGGPAAPTLTVVSPAQGPVAGGTAITLTGTGFTGATQVTVGGTAATSLVVGSDTSLTCVTPAGSAGAVAVVVTTPTGPATLSPGFTYRVVPTLTNVNPPSGPTTGGTLITLTGSGYLGGVTQVTVGGTAAVGVSVVNDSTCTCLTPTGAVGTVAVAVTTPGGSASLPGSFTYTLVGTPLTLTAVTPNSGFTSGGGKVTLTGTGFTSGSPGPNGVTFGGISATSVVAVDDSTITCTTPAGTLGLKNVAVTNAKGTQTLVNGFTYFTFPPTFRATNARLDLAANITTTEGPRLYGEGQYRYAVFSDRRAGNKRDIYFNRSTDGGATWLATDVRLDTKAVAGQYESVAPVVCSSGQYVYVVWFDWRNSAALDRGDIYFNRSTDYGATWLATDVRLDTDTTGLSDTGAPEICCNGSYVYVVWPDKRTGTGPRDIYFQRSTDNGATWLANDVRLDVTVTGSESRTPQIVCRGSNVYVVWADSRNDVNDIKWDIYLNRSADNGATWLAADVRLDTDTAGAAASQLPRIACGASDVCVVWTESRNGTTDVYLNRSADNGATWMGTDKRLNTGTTGVRYAVSPQVALDGASVCVAWTEDRTTVDKHDVYLNRSADGGATWLANDVRVSTDTIGTNEKRQPRMCASGGLVFLVWQDFRNASNRGDVYYNVSTDSGVTWRATDTRLNDDAAGTYTHDIFDVWCNGANFLVGWMDARNHGLLPLDIYVTCTIP